MDARTAFEMNKAFDELGHFQNEHGELYVLYRVNGINDVVFITGDEIDWEPGWIYENVNSRAAKVIGLTDDENEIAAAIVIKAAR